MLFALQFLRLYIHKIFVVVFYGPFHCRCIDFFNPFCAADDTAPWVVLLKSGCFPSFIWTMFLLGIEFYISTHVPIIFLSPFSLIFVYMYAMPFLYILFLYMYRIQMPIDIHHVQTITCLPVLWLLVGFFVATIFHKRRTCIKARSDILFSVHI